jgi:hypothetical protein
MERRQPPASSDPVQHEIAPAETDVSRAATVGADETETKTVAAGVLLGIIAGGTLGALVGLGVSLAPNIPWWGGLAVGLLAGVTAAGLMAGRGALQKLAGDSYGRTVIPESQRRQR